MDRSDFAARIHELAPSRQVERRSWGVWLRRLGYNIINGTQALGIVPGPVRARMVRLLGHKLSAGTFIDRHVVFFGSGLTTDGTVSINVGSMINASGPIHIEDGVRIACRVMLISETHEMGPPGQRAGIVKLLPIRIGRGCWIGAGAIVLPGVSVAPGCMVAAGAVVAKNTRPNGLYAGVPARRIKDLSGHATTRIHALLDAAVMSIDPSEQYSCHSK